MLRKLRELVKGILLENAVAPYFQPKHGIVELKRSSRVTYLPPSTPLRVREDNTLSKVFWFCNNRGALMLIYQWDWARMPPITFEASQRRFAVPLNFTMSASRIPLL